MRQFVLIPRFVNVAWVASRNLAGRGRTEILGTLQILQRLPGE